MPVGSTVGLDGTNWSSILDVLYAVRKKEAAYAIHSEQRLQAKEEEYRIAKCNAVVLPRSPEHSSGWPLSTRELPEAPSSTGLTF
jgi:hypothetical protein